MTNKQFKTAKKIFKDIQMVTHQINYTKGVLRGDFPNPTMEEDEALRFKLTRQKKRLKNLEKEFKGL